MRLISFYIENFGGLHNFCYEFKNKLNMISEDNGWGKTTMAVFIKSMFYGMESTTKRNIDHNERKKYLPWNGGKYGGYIEFKVNNKKYRIERYFGQRDRDDVFALYDLDTNLMSDDFSDNIGEEIFKIDREAFERSIYIPQQHISAETNDSLSAKLTNILESDNDINRFENAISRLSDASKFFKKKGDKGKISEIETELRIAQRELNDCESREKPYEELKNMLYVKQQLKAEYENTLNSIDTKIQRAGDYAGRNAKKAHYEQLRKDYEEKEKAVVEVEDFFANGIPEYDEVVSYEEYARRLTGFRHLAMQNVISDADREEYSKLQQMFEGYIPSDEELRKCEEAIDKIAELDGSIKAYTLTDDEKKQCDELEKVYASCNNFDNTIEECNKKYKRYMELGSEIEHENSNLIALEAWKDNNTVDNNSVIPEYNEIIVGATGIALVVLGVIFVSNMVESLGSILIGMGVTSVAVFFFMYLRRRWISPNEEKLIVKNEEDILASRTIINKLEVERKNIKLELTDFCEKYANKRSINGMVNILSDIQFKYNIYMTLSQKKASNDKKIVTVFDEIKENINIISNIIGKYEDVNSSTDKNDKKWRNILRNVKENITKYNFLKEKMSLYDDNYSLMREIEPALFGFVSKYFENVNQYEYEDCLLKIKAKVLELSRLMKELQTAADKLERFVAENNFDNTDVEEGEPIPLEVLKKERVDIITKINDVRDECDIIKTRCSEYYDVVTRKPELETEVERLKSKLNEATIKYNIFNTTKKYLEKAKEEFSSRYLTGLNEGFRKYVKILAGESEDMLTDKKSLHTATLDTALNVKFESYGSKKNVEYLSTGYRDLLGICSRFALVDCMYEAEKPFLILDDPFVNLDEEKINNALSFLERVSEEYQIIYFACHSSRVVK